MATVIAELVGFVVILVVLYRLVVPVLKRMVIERQAAVQRQVDEADEAERKLAEAQQRFDAAVSEARAEAARIRDDARVEATRIREELTAQAEREVERIKQRGEEQLAAQRDQVVRGLRAEIGGQLLQLAEQIVVEHLSDDTRRSATVDSFLGNLEGLADRGASDGEASTQATPSRGGRA
jgi:F-type H+-transporting ATPase subunit b